MKVEWKKQKEKIIGKGFKIKQSHHFWLFFETDAVHMLWDLRNEILKEPNYRIFFPLFFSLFFKVFFGGGGEGGGGWGTLI